MSFTEERRAAVTVEAMCRAMCRAEGLDPDETIDLGSLASEPGHPGPQWRIFSPTCHSMYLKHVAEQTMLATLLDRDTP